MSTWKRTGDDYWSITVGDDNDSMWIRVFRGHSSHKHWSVTCENVFIVTVRLGSTTIEDAKDEAIRVVADKLERMRASLVAFEAPRCRDVPGCGFAGRCDRKGTPQQPCPRRPL